MTNSRHQTVDGRTVEQMSASIVRAVRSADPSVLRAGRAWYGTARAEARAIADETGLTVSAAAGIIAALSPRMTWSLNVRGAWAIARAAVGGAASAPAVNTRTNRRLAWAIAHGARPLGTLGGRKVRSFYRNIMGDHEAVTVDVWAARAAGLERVSFTARQYATITDAYRSAARDLGLRPSHAQAAAWVAVRGSAA
jgi:hypothetical protein